MLHMDMKGIEEVLCAVADLAMPRTCIVCGEQLPLREKHLCAKCLCDLPLTFNWSLSRNQMADRFNELIQRDLERACLDSPPGGPGVVAGSGVSVDGPGSEPGVGPGSGGPDEPYAFAAALFLYRSGNGYSKITQSLKYHSNLRAGRFFARILGEKLSASPLFSDVDLVVPVPLHWTRMWSRGYNQAEVIAKTLARCLGAKMVPDLLVRARRTRTQTRLDIFQKARNVSGAFVINGKYLSPGKLSHGRHRQLPHARRWHLPHVRHMLPDPHHILIVDDVFTTGATVHACWSALRAAFPPGIRISAATLACVGY